MWCRTTSFPQLIWLWAWRRSMELSTGSTESVPTLRWVHLVRPSVRDMCCLIHVTQATQSRWSPHGTRTSFRFVHLNDLDWYEQNHSFVRTVSQDNIRKVHEQSERLQKPKATVLRMEQSDSRPVCNYSIQTVNSRHQVKELLRKQMHKVCWMHSVCTLICKGTSWWLKGQHKSVSVWVWVCACYFCECPHEHVEGELHY